MSGFDKVIQVDRDRLCTMDSVSAACGRAAFQYHGECTGQGVNMHLSQSPVGSPFGRGSHTERSFSLLSAQHPTCGNIEHHHGARADLYIVQCINASRLVSQE